MSGRVMHDWMSVNVSQWRASWEMTLLVGVMVKSDSSCVKKLFIVYIYWDRIAYLSNVSYLKRPLSNAAAWNLGKYYRSQLTILAMEGREQILQASQTHSLHPSLPEPETQNLHSQSWSRFWCPWKPWNHQNKAMDSRNQELASLLRSKHRSRVRRWKLLWDSPHFEKSISALLWYIRDNVTTHLVPSREMMVPFQATKNRNPWAAISGYARPDSLNRPLNCPFKLVT